MALAASEGSHNAKKFKFSPIEPLPEVGIGGHPENTTTFKLALQFMFPRLTSVSHAIKLVDIPTSGAFPRTALPRHPGFCSMGQENLITSPSIPRCLLRYVTALVHSRHRRIFHLSPFHPTPVETRVDLSCTSMPLSHHSSFPVMCVRSLRDPCGLYPHVGVYFHLSAHEKSFHIPSLVPCGHG